MRRTTLLSRSPLSSLPVAGCLAAALALGALLAGCGQPSGEVREWAPTDHDQPASVQNAAPPRPGAATKPAPAPAGNDDELVELAWQRNCATCHGPRGRGDGPQGAMMRAQDLTLPEWQNKVSDADITEVIRKGRNRMPAFDLPPQVIQGLVKRIRANKKP